MRDDIPAAAFRLACSLPCVTHRRDMGPERGENNRNARNAGHFGKRKLVVVKPRGRQVIFGKGGKARPVQIGGMVYPSATDAARTRHRSTRTIYEWLRTGEAEYV